MAGPRGEWGGAGAMQPLAMATGNNSKQTEHKDFGDSYLLFFISLCSHRIGAVNNFRAEKRGLETGVRRTRYPL